eukprot:GHVS01094144.1.p1 GENE.GHVS01094144.1~~GHVS01094144.1.p1  ORF type:complete len:246 (-),score=12.20 GHVS01094144.1:207-944(-)
MFRKVKNGNKLLYSMTNGIMSYAMSSDDTSCMLAIRDSLVTATSPAEPTTNQQLTMPYNIPSPVFGWLHPYPIDIGVLLNTLNCFHLRRMHQVRRNRSLITKIRKSMDSTDPTRTDVTYEGTRYLVPPSASRDLVAQLDRESKELLEATINAPTLRASKKDIPKHNTFVDTGCLLKKFLFNPYVEEIIWDTVYDTNGIPELDFVFRLEQTTNYWGLPTVKSGRTINDLLHILAYMTKIVPPTDVP